MKKLLAIILAVTMLLPVFAVNSFAASYDFSLDTFGSSGDPNHSSYDRDTKTITFNNGWTGRGWWIGNDGIALTDIESITINFTENTIGCQVVVNYATGTNQTFDCPANTTSVTATFTEDPVSQVYIQSYAAGKIVLDSVSVNPRTPAAEEPDDDYETVLTFVKDGKGVINPSIDYTTKCVWGSKVVSESNSAQLATLKEKMQVEGARFVLKYTITSDEGAAGGWWNFYQLNIGTGATEYTIDAAVLQDTLNGTAMENHWSLLNDGEHVVILNCSDYISKIEAAGLSVDDIKSLGMQSGLEDGRSVYVSEWYLEAPAQPSTTEVPVDLTSVNTDWASEGGGSSTTNGDGSVTFDMPDADAGPRISFKLPETYSAGDVVKIHITGSANGTFRTTLSDAASKGGDWNQSDIQMITAGDSTAAADFDVTLDYTVSDGASAGYIVVTSLKFDSAAASAVTIKSISVITQQAPAPVTPVTVPGFRGYIYVNEQYHAMFIGKHFIALEHIDNGTGVCPLCHAELAEADPNAEKIVYSVEKTQGQDSEGAELASGVPCIDAQGAENYFRVATNWVGGGAVWNDLASAIKTEGTIMRVTYTGTITALVYQTDAGSYEVIEGFEVADTEDGRKVLTISCADIAAAAPVALSGDFGGWGNFTINYDGDTTLYGIEVVVPAAGGAAAAEDDIVVVE